MKLDEIDRLILSQLRDNAQLPLKRLADQVGIHSNTIIKRIKRLERAGVITKYVAEVDYYKAGWNIHVIIFMKMKRDQLDDYTEFKNLSRYPEFESIYATIGHWEVIAVCRLKDRHHLIDLVERLGKDPLVVETTTQLVLLPYKKACDFNPFSPP